MKHFIFACVAALGTTGAAADPLTDLIGSKAYWQAMDWEKVEQSRIWRMSGWAPFEGKQEAGRTFEKERPVEIDGKNLRAHLIVEEMPTRQNILSIYSTELSPNECKQISDWLTNKFGRPRRVVDASYSFDLVAKGNTIENIDKMSQWDIGATRTTFTCAGLKTAAAEKVGEKNKLAGILVFGSKAREREIKPLFGLRCTRRIEYIGIGRPPESLDDIVLIIDENRKRVSASNKVPFPGERRITDDAIEFQIKANDVLIDNYIDRHTGSLNAKYKYLKGAGLSANVTGHCEINEPGERKF